MPGNTLQLPGSITQYLTRFPEHGMGYQVVKVILKTGRELHHLKVLNSELLILAENEKITATDILRIELEQT